MPAMRVLQGRDGGIGIFQPKTFADGDNSTCFGGRRWDEDLRRNIFPLPVIPRISVWATSPLCRFRKYGVLLSVSSTARYSVPRWVLVFSPGRIVKRNDRS